MADSATSRELTRTRTGHRISTSARRLTLERGFDGFTVAELAAESGVSRRTLFNYFPSKLDAVLGTAACVSPADLVVFTGGGPYGDLVEDLGVLAKPLLEEKALDQEYLDLGRRVLCFSPRVAAAAHQRFEEFAGQFVTLILEREGEQFGAARARLLVALLVAIYDAALSTQLAEPGDRTLAEHYDHMLHTARQLLC